MNNWWGMGVEWWGIVGNCGEWWVMVVIGWKWLEIVGKLVVNDGKW